MVLEPLLTVERRNGRFRPVLAERWHPLKRKGKISGWRLQLRKDVRWHDGRPFTAKDVRFTLGVVTNGRPVGARAKRGLRTLAPAQLPIADVKLYGKHTVEIWLNAPYGPFLERLSRIPMLPEHRFEACGFEETCPPTAKKKKSGPKPFCHLDLSRPACGVGSVEMVGTGPFQVLQWWPTEKLVYVRNGHYWGEKARLKRIEFLFVQELEKAMKMMRQGRLDLLADLTSPEWARLRKTLFTGKMKKRFRTITAHPFGRTVLVFRNFRNRFVRRAFCLLLDRSALAKAIPGDMPIVIRNPVGHQSYQQQLFPGAHYSGGVEAAENLLDKAGIKKKSDGFRYWGNSKLVVRMVLPKSALVLRRFFEKSAKLFEKVGIDLKVDTVSRIAYLSALQGRTLRGRLRTEARSLYPGRSSLRGLTVVQMAGLSAWTDLYAGFHSTHAVGKLNPSDVKDGALDKLLDKWLAETDRKKRRELSGKILERIWQQAPFLPLFSPQLVAVAAQNVQGVRSGALWFDLTQARIKH
jgi:peptide/nickel transport system substrate-binding protein